jgi:hypothetical protein
MALQPKKDRSKKEANLFSNVRARAQRGFYEGAMYFVPLSIYLSQKNNQRMKTCKSVLCLIPLVVILFSCQKELSTEAGSNNGGGGSGGSTSNCNNTVMKLKRWQATFDPDYYIETAWNNDGTIQSIKVNVSLSDYRTAKFTYANGRIKEAVLYENATNSVYDTAVYRYNAVGKVDSMYLKNNDGFGIRLTYNSNNKLVKYTRHESGGDVMFYWNIVTDANDNITKAEEYWNNSSGFDKETIYTFTRDTKKNPLAGLAPYMMYLDDDYQSFWYWGPNNFTDQRYQDLTGSGIDLTTGYKFKYNGSCYPTSAQNTIMGQPVFTDDDFTFSYY